MTRTIEMTILGFMMLDNSIDSNLLNEDLFLGDKNRLAFQTIREMKEMGEVAELATVSSRLEGKVDYSHLSDMFDGIGKSPFNESYFKNHVNLLIRIKKEQEIKLYISNQADEPNFIPRLQQLLEDYELEATDPIDSHTLSAKTEQLQEFIEKKRASEFWGLELTCFPRLTKALMGLREIIVLSADPKVGKSTFVLQIASDVAGQGAGVLYFDFENGPLNLMTRELCRKSTVSQAQLFKDRAEDPKIEAVIKQFKECKNFAIIADRTLNIEKIRSRVFQMRRMINREEILVVVDSLQKLPMKDLKDRRAAIDGWLRNFEALKANDPHLTILMVSELSRDGGKPKESGDIEYTGHFLLRFETNQTKEDLLKSGDDFIRNLWIEYARDVATGGIIKYKADFEYWKFEESSED